MYLRRKAADATASNRGVSDTFLSTIGRQVPRRSRVAPLRKNQRWRVKSVRRLGTKKPEARWEWEQASGAQAAIAGGGEPAGKGEWPQAVKGTFMTVV